MKIISFAILVFILFISKMSAEFSQSKINTIDKTLQSWVDSDKYSGIVNLTYSDGEIVHFKAYGYKDLETQAIPRLKPAS